jgi:hypothetical protein
MEANNVGVLNQCDWTVLVGEHYGQSSVEFNSNQN